MRIQVSAGFWIELALTVIGALLTGLTVVRPDWIEAAFGIDPDARGGASEWALSLALLVATAALGALTGRRWRRER